VIFVTLAGGCVALEDEGGTANERRRALGGGGWPQPPPSDLSLPPWGTSCGPVTAQGCCFQGQAAYCNKATNKLVVASCASTPKCGWNSTLKRYSCGTGGAADPSGTNPKSCTGGRPPGDQGAPPDVYTGDFGTVTCGDNKCSHPLEDCGSCPQDCGKCTGCQISSSAGCPGCACTSCVCQLDPACCTQQWDKYCVQTCKSQCGGCPASDSGPTPADVGSPAVDQYMGDLGTVSCGDNKCSSPAEDCGSCPQDCGKCTGCEVKAAPGCPGCKCEKCVCANDPACCTNTWDQFCVQECKNNCSGCGLTDAGVLSDLPPIPDQGFSPVDQAAPPPDMSVLPADQGGSAADQYTGDVGAVACGDNKCASPAEDCVSCPKDCGKCTGCEIRNSPKCPGCACETCVCSNDPACCSNSWDQFCVLECKTNCGGCNKSDAGAIADLPPIPDQGATPKLDKGAPPKLDKGAPPKLDKGAPPKLDKGAPPKLDKGTTPKLDKGSPPKPDKGAPPKLDKGAPPKQDKGAPPADQTLPDLSGKTCGDNKCDAPKEDCGSCPQDCGKCTGCQVKSAPGCPGCACEKCVCKNDPACCTNTWDKFCVQECKTNCGGCSGSSDAGTGKDKGATTGDKGATTGDKGATTGDKGATTGDKGGVKKEAGARDKGQAKDVWGVNPDSSTGDKGGDTGCNCRVDGAGPASAAPLWPAALLLIGLLRRRRKR